MAKKEKNLHSREETREELKDVVGCLSCALPTRRTVREAPSDIATICPGCAGKDGHLRSYGEATERLATQHHMKELRMDRPDAEKAAQEKMSALSAWKDVKV